MTASCITRLADVTAKIVTSGFRLFFFFEQGLKDDDGRRRIDDAANWSGLNRTVFIPGAIPVQEARRGHKPAGLKTGVNSIGSLAKCFLRAGRQIARA